MAARKPAPSGWLSACCERSTLINLRRTVCSGWNFRLLVDNVRLTNAEIS